MQKHRDWLTHREREAHKKERKSKTPKLLSALSTRCVGSHPKGVIVAS